MMGSMTGSLDDLERYASYCQTHCGREVGQYGEAERPRFNWSQHKAIAALLANPAPVIAAIRRCCAAANVAAETEAGWLELQARLRKDIAGVGQLNVRE